MIRLFEVTEVVDLSAGRKNVHDVLLLDDGAGNGLDFAVGCYDEDAQEATKGWGRALHGGLS
jgi:hypothetical protein